MNSFTPSKNHFRQTLLFPFMEIKGTIRPYEAWKWITSVYGDGSISQRSCKKWIDLISTGNFNVDDKDRPRRPNKIDTVALKEKKSRKTLRILREGFRIRLSVIKERFQKILS